MIYRAEPLAWAGAQLLCQPAPSARPVCLALLLVLFLGISWKQRLGRYWDIRLNWSKSAPAGEWGVPETSPGAETEPIKL